MEDTSSSEIKDSIPVSFQWRKEGARKLNFRDLTNVEKIVPGYQRSIIGIFLELTRKT